MRLSYFFVSYFCLSHHIIFVRIMPHEVSMRSKEKLLEAMFIPGDAVCKEYSLTMVGNSQLFVEGVEAVKELSTELIKLRVRKGFLVVTGEKLHVDSLKLYS